MFQNEVKNFLRRLDPRVREVETAQRIALTMAMTALSIERSEGSIPPWMMERVTSAMDDLIQLREAHPSAVL